MLSRLATASAPKKNARGIISRPHQLWRVTGDEHVARDGLGVSLLDVFVDTVHQQQHHRLAQGSIERQDDRCDGNAQGQAAEASAPACMARDTPRIVPEIVSGGL